MSINPLADKSKAFSLRAITIFDQLCTEKREYVLSKQFLRSATSIGANLKEAQRAQSLPDFYAKISISLKEADETFYWLELLHESGKLSEEQFASMYADCNELLRMLVAAAGTTKKRILAKKTK